MKSGANGSMTRFEPSSTALPPFDVQNVDADISLLRGVVEHSVAMAQLCVDEN